MKILKSTLLIACFATLTGCINSDEYMAPDLSGQCTTLVVTKPVSDITALATASLVKYEDEDVIEAYVTSSDEGGNFYKSISLVNVENTIGFSIPVDTYNLYTMYQPGRKVFVNMKDRYIVKDNGAPIIGNLYNNDTPDDDSDDDVGRISGAVYRDILKRGCDAVNEDELVKHLTISEAKQDKYLNMLVEFDGAEFTNASKNKKFYDPSLNSIGSATNHLITDISGGTVILRVSMYATFASYPTPAGNGRIRGVMTKFGSDYQFMVRTLNDLDLDGPKLQALFNESFSTNFPNWTKFSVAGPSQNWVLDNTFGNPGACAKMSGFSGGAVVNDDWLISPVIDLSTLASSANLTFDTATKFAGNPLEVMISTDYAGTGNPTTATWTPITGYTLSPSTGNYVWTGSGLVNINSYVGQQIYIAFRYTSTSAAAATWEVDNVKIIGN